MVTHSGGRRAVTHSDGDRPTVVVTTVMVLLTHSGDRPTVVVTDPQWW
jgi:hypothetical protein